MANEHLRSLRSTLEWLKKEDLLLESDREIDPKCELTAIQKRLDGGPPMVFNKVRNIGFKDFNHNYRPIGI